MAKILKAAYANEKKTAIVVEVQLPNIKGSVKYAAIQHGAAPLNRELWKRIVEDKEIHIDPYVEPKEIEEGVDEEVAAQKEFELICGIVDYKVDQQLKILCSPQCEIRGEYDEEFEAKRTQLMKEWYEVYKQEGYPFDVDYPETVPAKFYREEVVR